MNKTHKDFQYIFNELSALAISDKIVFMEMLLFNFTITGRAIWSEGQQSDSIKVEAFKWLNELSHRIWNILFDLRRGENNDSITRLYDHMKLYAEQSHLLSGHLAATTVMTFKSFEDRKQH